MNPNMGHIINEGIVWKLIGSPLWDHIIMIEIDWKWMVPHSGIILLL